MRTFAVLCAVLVLAASQALAVTVDMNQQINLGLGGTSQSPSGDAIYPAFNSDTQTIYADGTLEAEGFTRHNMTTLPGSWWYQYLDLNLAGVGSVDLSAPGSKIEFDTRYFQDFETNSNAYGDAPVFLRLYTYAADGNSLVGYRDYSIVYATQAPWSNPPYPTWTRVTVDIAGGTDSGLDTTRINRIRWYGTDWSGGGFDFVDFKNVTLTPGVVPEPCSMLALLAGCASLIPVIRRRR